MSFPPMPPKSALPPHPAGGVRSAKRAGRGVHSSAACCCVLRMVVGAGAGGGERARALGPETGGGLGAWVLLFWFWGLGGGVGRRAVGGAVRPASCDRRAPGVRGACLCLCN
jgi:hypothetical protein